MDSDSKFWTHEKTVEFIDLFKESQCLWNPQHPQFKDTTSKNVAWEDLSQAVGCDSIEARRKMKNLQGQFSREEKKLKQKRKAGATGELSSTWNYYKHMLFVKNKRKYGFKCGMETGDEVEVSDETELQEAMDNLASTGNESSSSVTEPVTILREKPMTRRQTMAKTKKLINSADIIDDEEDDMKISGGMMTMTTTRGGSRELVRGNVRRDNSDIFGELVAGKLKRLKTEHARNTVEHLISNILWEASLGKYDHPNRIVTSADNDIIIESIAND
ncbi:hypothetical protein CHUAL_000153 [Chamberlinius hualienensis]